LLVGIEMHPAYAAIARRRLAAAVRFRDRGGDDPELAAGSGAPRGAARAE
jgi:hypothetical protein